MLDFFAYFNLKPALLADEKALRQAYLNKQREWHPDFHAAGSAEYETALAESAKNNEAYKTLQTLHGRIQYVLSETGAWKEGEKHALPPDFLADMLDLHDLIVEAAMGDEQARMQATSQLSGLEIEVDSELRHHAAEADAHPETWSLQTLGSLRNAFEKYRYLTRLRKNLDGKSEM